MLKKLLIVSGFAFAAACGDHRARASHAVARSSVPAAVPAADSTHLIALTDTIERLPLRLDSVIHRPPKRGWSKIADSTWEAINWTLAQVINRVPESAEREWLIGEVFESAHHVDLHKNAYEAAERYLNSSVELDSTFAPARIALARLWINSDLTEAPRAEALLRGTPTVKGSPDALAVHEGLAFALYYQGRVAAAAEEAQQALAAGSQNDGMSMMALRAGPIRPKGR